MRSVELLLNVLDEEHAVHTDTDTGTDRQANRHGYRDRQTGKQID